MTFKFIKAGLAALALFAVPVAAQAADVPIKAPFYKGSPQSVVSYYNWSGFYAGVNAGYGFGTSTWSGLAVATEIKPKGFMAGGTAGYNWQSGAIVYGIEGDFDWSGVKDSVACGPLGLVTCETANSWLATFRGRVGYAFDRWLPYLTGGAAYGNVKATTSAPVLGTLSSASSNQFGWAFGAGLEYAFMGNWTAKLEYLYVDLGSFNAGTAVLANNVSFKESIIRAGINYKFSGPILSRF
jgi:outer membrane immunogenic protein